MFPGLIPVGTTKPSGPVVAGPPAAGGASASGIKAVPSTGPAIVKHDSAIPAIMKACTSGPSPRLVGTDPLSAVKR